MTLMNIDPKFGRGIVALAKFEVALRDLCEQHGYEVVETPVMAYGPAGLAYTPSGTAVWTVYDPETGSPTVNYCIQLRSKITGAANV